MLTVPARLPVGDLEDVLTGRRIAFEDVDGHHEIAVSEVLRDLPVAVLANRIAG